MGERSSIEWCDSTFNLMMGCDGCELWNPKTGVKDCYAGVMTERKVAKAPLKGWPIRFEEPTIFPERMKELRRWKDLTGTTRPEKPWLNGLPRIIFWNDMGDAFTKSLPEEWLAPYLEEMAAMPHLHLFLTKQAERMAEFFAKHGCPENVWPGVSITGPATLNRIKSLQRIASPHRFLSVEPLLDHIEQWNLKGIAWVIVGGASGPNAKVTAVPSLRGIVRFCQNRELPVFVKQLGSNIQDRNDAGFDGDDPEGWPEDTETEDHPNGYREDYQGAPVRLHLRDRKGGDPAEWPEDLRVREMPT